MLIGFALIVVEHVSDSSYKNGAGFYGETHKPTSKLYGLYPAQPPRRVACPIFRRRHCKKPEETWEEFAVRLDASQLEELSQKKIRFVLTVAHLDHDTSRNDFDNLKALCSVCHLRYDAKYHAETRKKKRVI